VIPDEADYKFVDRRLDRMTPAAKHLLRFGSANARQVQAKAAEIGRAAGILPL
jgi:hypothetical protein